MGISVTDEARGPAEPGSGRKRFSIIIPTRDRPGQLAACLEAVSRLDYPRAEFEVIVVDDQGDQPARTTAEPFAPRLDLQVLRQDWGGPAVARNTGAAQARGQYLCFTDSDCRPEPDWLRRLERRLDDEPKTAVGGRTLDGAPDSIYSAASQAILDAVHAFFNERPGRPMFFPPTNLAVPATLFRQCGGYDPRFTVSEDRDFCDRWHGLGGRFRYAPEAVVYHAHPLGCWGFARRHLNYGRGARRFHLTRTSQNGNGPLADLRFYPFLLRHAFQHGGGARALGVGCLVVLAKAIYTVGYSREALARAPAPSAPRPAAASGP